MDISQFIHASTGQWRSQRSAHHLAFAHFEAVQSTIDIVALTSDDPTVVDLCRSYQIDPLSAVAPFRMSWQGLSDWNEAETLQGSSVLVPVPDPLTPRRGQLLRDYGYAESIPAAATYHFCDDDTFVLLTVYDRAAAEEKIWFVTPNLRCRVSLIKTSDGNGVVTASFSSEIRAL